jgi:uncharacterized protein (TIGR02246 family)
MSPEDAIRDLYRQVIDGWNAGDAAAMAGPMAPDALMIGFDGSQLQGRHEVEGELGRIFADHETASYATKVRAVSKLGGDTALVWAVAGMPSPETSEIMPDRNAVQTLVARRDSNGWSVALFQTTPAQLHGREDLRKALTEELSEELAQQS